MRLITLHVLTLTLTGLYWSRPNSADVATQQPNLRNSAITQMAKVASLSDKVIPYSTLEENCVKNPIDSTCRKPDSLETNYLHNSQHPIDSASTATAPSGLDDENQLRDRLARIDKFSTPYVFQNIEASASNADSLAETNSTLKQVLLIHRHGDRTPINFPPKDNLKDEPFWAFHGYGQLTNRGKQRLYILGKIMSRRYGLFMEYSVNKNQRVSRSSGSLRCIESAQTFLSSFLGLDLAQSPDAKRLIWDDRINSLGSMWQPASVQAMPAPVDGMLAESATCNKLTDEYSAIDNTQVAKELTVKYKHEADVMRESYGMEMDHFFKWFWASSQIEVERSYFPDKMKPEILAIYDRVQEAGTIALGAYQSTLLSKRLRSGLLINDMVTGMKRFRDLHRQGVRGDSPQVKKFLHYAAHDMTNIVLLGMLGNWKNFQARPEYASNIILELHHDTIQDKWHVRFFYMPEVKGYQTEPVEMFVEGCSENGVCDLDTFERLMRPYMIGSWQSWMQECGNDLSSIDPYLPGE